MNYLFLGSLTFTKCNTNLGEPGPCGAGDFTAKFL